MCFNLIYWTPIGSSYFLVGSNLKNVTQRGIWYPSGELGNSSKVIIKRNMEKNMTNKLILLKKLNLSRIL